MFYQTIEQAFATRGIAATNEQLCLLEKFYDLLTEKNKVMNLTRITSPEDAANKHFYDSVSILKYIELPAGARVIDIGTGAGFPAIPLCILRPDLSITAVDASGKKAAFVAETATALGLNIKALSARAEELARDIQHREMYDYALSRAVASLPVLLELCIPFLKPGGQFIAYKGADFKNELALSQTAIKKLMLQQNAVLLPFVERQHALIVFAKLETTPAAYPRKFSQIISKPL
jgi:16S rRNA (guanine527-N7)-methyltransferase